MLSKTSATLMLCVALIDGALAQYHLVDAYTKDNFFSSFDFFADADPTHGFVSYQPIIGVDYTTNATALGRQSIRLSSKKTYNQGLLLADNAHVLENVCGSWPAL